MTPDYRITLDGQDLTPIFAPRLESLTLTDARGFQVDTLDLTLTDHDGRLAIPPRGAKLHLHLGWVGQGLEDKGTYLVDEVEHAGAPDKLTLRARSADLRSALTKKLECSYHGHTLGNIVRATAARNNLTPLITTELANIDTGHIDQSGESDAALLTRLATEYGAIATVKAGRLLFIKPGQATTAGGTPLTTVTLTRQLGDQHRYNVADRGIYTAVRAYYHDTRLAQRASVTVGDEEVIDSTDQDQLQDPTAQPLPAPAQASAPNTKELRHTYSSRPNALRAAHAELNRIQRGIATFSLTLAHARPDLFPEIPVTVTGFKPQIDADTWLITRATHRLDSSGFVTVLDLELKIEN